jgi:hypothetical protein
MQNCNSSVAVTASQLSMGFTIVNVQSCCWCALIVILRLKGRGKLAVKPAAVRSSSSCVVVCVIFVKERVLLHNVGMMLCYRIHWINCYRCSAALAAAQVLTTAV